MKKVLPTIAAVLVAACTYQNPVGVTPAFNATQTSENPAAPGSYVLVIDPDGARLSRTVRASGLSCLWDTYPVNIRATAPESARSALQQVFHGLQLANAVPERAEMRRASIRGAITVRVERFGTRLDFKDSNSTGVATTEFALSATLNGADGRGFATSARSIKKSAARPGSECQGARAAVGHSIELAMRDAFEQLGASLSRYEESVFASSAPRQPKAKTAAVADENAERIARDRLAAMKRQVDSEALNSAPRRPSATPAALSRRLTPAQIDAVRLQIQRCLTDTRFHDAQTQSVAIRFRLNPDGSLASPPEISDAGRLQTDERFRIVANGTQQALIACTPLKGLPRASYEQWRDMTLAFDARDLQPR